MESSGHGNRDVAFYTVSDSNYFLGVVALVNSLRLIGHAEPVVILDCGLTDRQRELLSAHCTLVPIDPALKTARSAHYYKLIAPRGTGEPIKLIIDSDMIVTGHLGKLVEAVRAGKVVGFADPEQDRWFAEWQAIHQLPDVPRHQTYMCSGFVGFDTRVFPDLLGQWRAACRRTEDQPEFSEGIADSPTAQADQDALNAVLMGLYPGEAVEFMPYDACVQAWELRWFARVSDLATLACTNRGTKALILHTAGHPKPWRSPQALRRNAFVLLLRRLLSGPDVAIRVDPGMIPTWLRPDLKGRVQLWSTHWRTLGGDLPWLVRERLPWLVRERLKRLPFVPALVSGIRRRMAGLTQ
jgi:hypothetical protein